MTGDLDMGSQDVINVGTVDGVDLSALGNTYVKRDGSNALTADWDIGDGRFIEADEIRARNSAGLKLFEDNGTSGIFVKSDGKVGMGVTGSNIVRLLHLRTSGSPGAYSSDPDCALLIENSGVVSLQMVAPSSKKIFFGTSGDPDMGEIVNYAGGDMELTVNSRAEGIRISNSSSQFVPLNDNAISNGSSGNR